MTIWKAMLIILVIYIGGCVNSSSITQKTYGAAPKEITGSLPINGQATEVDLNEFDSLTLKVIQLYINGDYYDASLKVEELIGISVGVYQESLSLNLKGNILVALKRYRDAFVAYEKALELYPTDQIRNNFAKAKSDYGSLSYLINEEKNHRPTVINFIGKTNQLNTGYLVKVILSEFAAGQNKFHINLSSTGGNADAALAAYNTISQLPVNITTHNSNDIQSAGIYLFCLGSKRTAHENSYFMIHAPKWSVKNYEPDNYEAFSKRIDINQKGMISIYKSCMDINANEISSYLSGGADWNLSFSDAYEKGLVTQRNTDVEVPKKVYLITDLFRG